MNNRLFSFLKMLMICLFTLFISIEVYYRVIDYFYLGQNAIPIKNTNSSLKKSEEKLVQAFKMGSKIIEYRHNSFEFREKEKKNRICKKKKCICIFGASRIYGDGLKEEERFSNIIENKVNYPVYNFGIRGAQPVDIFRSVKDQTARFQCGLVLIEAQLVRIEMIDQPFDFYGRKKQYLEEVLDKLILREGRDNQYLINELNYIKKMSFSTSLRQALRNNYKQNIIRELGIEKSKVRRSDSTQFRFYMRYLAEIANELKDKGSHVTFITKYQLILRDFLCKEFSCLNIKLDKNYRINKYFKHVNEEGNKKVADMIINYFQEHKLVETKLLR